MLVNNYYDDVFQQIGQEKCGTADFRPEQGTNKGRTGNRLGNWVEVRPVKTPIERKPLFSKLLGNWVEVRPVKT